MSNNQQRIYPKISPRHNLIVFALLLSLGCFAETSAQWTTSGPDQNINKPNTGIVGIGITAPTALFEVKKSQNAGTTSTNAGHSGLLLKQGRASRFFVGSIYNNNSHTGPKPAMFGNFLAGNITSYTLLYPGYDTQSNVIMELGYGTATSNVVPLASLVLSKNLTSANSAIGVISFANSSIADGSEKRLATIGVSTDGLLNSGVMAFGTASGGTVNERMRINSSGNIGIGTTTPSYSLDLNGGVNSFRVKGATTSVNDALATFENTSAIQMIVRGNGNVGIGRTDPTEKLDIIGNVKVSGNINAKYQDLAEWVDSSEDLRAGTVVVLDVKRPNHVMASTASYDTRVAGVISDRPGITLGEHADGKVLVATTGRVKIKVSAKNGPINIGDLLVTSDQTGVAMKSNAVRIGGVRMHRPGTLIGKALEPLAQGTAEILVLLSLQ